MMSFGAELKTAVTEALAVVFPVHCSGCSLPDVALCESCLASIPLELYSLGNPHPIIAATSYQGVMKDALLDYKQHGQTVLASTLAPFLREALYRLVSELNRVYGSILSEASQGIELVVPPQTPKAKRSRGYHPVELLLRRLGFRNARVLRLVSVPADQRELNAAERVNNMRNRFAATEPLNGRAFITIDDVTTTGATLAEIGRAIQEGGGWHLGSAVLCHTPRKID